MKRFTSMKKALSLLMSMMMVLALGTTAFAANGQDTSAYYFQDAESAYATSEPITVYVTIESYKNDDGVSLLKTRIPVTLDPEGTSKTFTVTDALVALQSDASNGLLFMDDAGIPLEAGDSYMMYVQAGEDMYGPSGEDAYDGWMVRVNDRFAILGDNPAFGGLYGAAINTTYLSNGDYIHIYMDNTSSLIRCAKYTKLTPSYSNGVLTLNIEESHNWFDTTSPYTWHITNFTSYNVPATTFRIYKNGSDTPIKIAAASGNTVSISVNLDANETYTIVMDNAFSETRLNFTSASAVFTIPSAI